MYHERLITGVAATLGGIAVVLTVVGLTGTPVALPVALAFAASAVLMYDQLSGRMAARVYRRVERHARVDERGATGRSGRSGRRDRRQRRRRRAKRGGFGAGPREEWTPPRDGATMGEAAAGRGRSNRAAGARQTGASRGTGRDRTGGAGTGPGPTGRVDDGPTAAEAYRALGLDPGADEATIKQAYRERVKEVHPDTTGGDEEEFMAVKAAYERLTD